MAFCMFLIFNIWKKHFDFLYLFLFQTEHKMSVEEVCRKYSTDIVQVSHSLLWDYRLIYPSHLSPFISSFLSSRRVWPTPRPQSTWPGMAPTPWLHPQLPRSGSSSAASSSVASPSSCGSAPSSASWPTPSRLPLRMSLLETMWVKGHSRNTVPIQRSTLKLCSTFSPFKVCFAHFSIKLKRWPLKVVLRQNRTYSATTRLLH